CCAIASCVSSRSSPPVVPLSSSEMTVGERRRAGTEPVTRAPRRRDDVWRRRWLAVALGTAVMIGLPLALGHRGTHMALNLVLPGAGLFGVHTLAAIGFVVAAVVAIE